MGGWVVWVVVLTLLFSQPLTRLMVHAAQSELLSYILLVPLIVVYLLLTEQKTRLAACRSSIAGTMIVGVRADTQPGVKANIEAIALSLYAVASVAWWVYTDSLGADDLRPYLLLQGLPLILIPLWQAIYRAPRTDRLAFAAAMGLEVVANVAELNDPAIANALGFVSGHTLKHLIATLATAAVVWGLNRRFAAGASAK